MWLAAMVGMLCLTALIFGIATVIANRRGSPRERRLAQFARDARKLANQYRETDAGLAYAILDQIETLEAKELL